MSKYINNIINTYFSEDTPDKIYQKIYEKYKLSSSYNEEDKVCGLCVIKSVLLQDENYKKILSYIKNIDFYSDFFKIIEIVIKKTCYCGFFSELATERYENRIINIYYSIIKTVIKPLFCENYFNKSLNDLKLNQYKKKLNDNNIYYFHDLKNKDKDFLIDKINMKNGHVSRLLRKSNKILKNDIVLDLIMKKVNEDIKIMNMFNNTAKKT